MDSVTRELQNIEWSRVFGPTNTLGGQLVEVERQLAKVQEARPAATQVQTDFPAPYQPWTAPARCAAGCTAKHHKRCLCTEEAQGDKQFAFMKAVLIVQQVASHRPKHPMKHTQLGLLLFQPALWLAHTTRLQNIL